MVKVKYSGKSVEYLEGFPKDCLRSCKGALHLQPGSVKEMTDGEYAYIKQAFPKLRLFKIEEPMPAVKAEAEAEKPAEALKVSMKKTKVKRK